MIGIIGAGNMGMAIASAIKGKVILSDKNKRLPVSHDNTGLAKRSDIIILAVKPQDIMAVLQEIKPYVRTKLIISIAAGIRTNFLEKILGRVRIVRIMPNMPAMVRKGISAICCGRFARPGDFKIASKIFSNLGEIVEVKEGMMDAVTAVSGSSPAYYFLFTHLLQKAGEASGLKKNLAMRLARAAFIGSAKIAESSRLSMEELVKRVASKGGTTEAALEVFEQKKLGEIVKKAVGRAAHRSKQLCRGQACLPPTTGDKYKGERQCHR